MPGLASCIARLEASALRSSSSEMVSALLRRQRIRISPSVDHRDTLSYVSTSRRPSMALALLLHPCWALTCSSKTLATTRNHCTMSNGCISPSLALCFFLLWSSTCEFSVYIFIQAPLTLSPSSPIPEITDADMAFQAEETHTNASDKPFIKQYRLFHAA